MSLRIAQRQSEGILILSLSGRLVLGEEAAAFQLELDRVLDAGFSALLLDMRSLSFVDSTGLGTLVGAHSTLKRAGGTLKLLHVSQKHLQLLILTKLTTIFQLFDDEQQAIDSFFPDRERKRFDILEFVKREEKEDPDKLP